MFTDGHPNRDFSNSLWNAYLRGGVLHKSGGTPVRRIEEGFIQVEEATRVYNGVDVPAGEAWVWDIHLDRDGRPVIAYTSLPSPMDHRYRYARWNGQAWGDRQIAHAGKRLYETQQYYSGGIALDPDDTRLVYLSSNVDVRTGRPGRSGHWEIYRGETTGGGRNWKWKAATRRSKVDNLRPIVPAGHPGKRFVLWYRGAYPRTDAKLPPVKRAE